MFKLLVVILLLFVSLISLPVRSQTSNISVPLEMVDVPLVSWLASRPHASKNSTSDFAIAPRTRDRFSQLIRSVLDHNWLESKKLAKRIGYEVVIISDDGNKYIVVQEKFSAGFGPTVVIAVEPTRNVIAEAPHAAFEIGTKEQAAIFLTKLGFRAAIISGAHRCASQSFVSCRGSTRVCGDRSGSPYRTSDVAHNPQTLFHTAHLTLSEVWKGAKIISLHGMRKRGQTIAILSDGSKSVDTNNQKTVKILRDNYRDLISANLGDVFSCNHSDDTASSFPKLCGFTNVQGIQLNGPSGECGLSTFESSGSFLHIEQTWEILGEFRRQWGNLKQTKYAFPLLKAMSMTFPEDVAFEKK